MIPRVLVFIAAVGLDRAVKYWAETYLKPVGQMDFLPGFLSLHYTQNTGAAFGMLKNMRWMFIVLTAVVLVFVVIAFVRKWINRPLEKWAIVLIAGGAVGNFIDRIYQGYVVDMFSFDFISFAIFNVADIFVTCGGVLLIISLIFLRTPGKRR